jgi:hypothetical protein
VKKPFLLPDRSDTLELPPKVRAERVKTARLGKEITKTSFLSPLNSPKVTDGYKSPLRKEL